MFFKQKRKKVFNFSYRKDTILYFYYFSIPGFAFKKSHGNSKKKTIFCSFLNKIQFTIKNTKKMENVSFSKTSLFIFPKIRQSLLINKELSLFREPF